ncbi:MAG: biotin--[acetyl-CoA-carboxylase] ligase [Sphaerochaetaceae bacterium]|nr:biotin--[acetyl-CoA-carboxylase] ligase [Sphaerochaetaceae bacterium]
MENKASRFQINEALELLVFEELDSTNNYLKALVREGASTGTCVWAKKQTSGRGRLGRSFVSPEGGVYLSLVLPKGENPFTITAKAGVAVKRTIEKVCNKKCSLKWVNDVLLNNKKVCGILAEGVLDKVVLGIGVNYCTSMSYFDEELQNIVETIYEKEAKVPIETFVKVLCEEVWNLCSFENDNSWLQEYRTSNVVPGKHVKVYKGGILIKEGKALFIDDDCFLHIMYDDNTEETLSTGEVTIRW